MQNYCYQVVEIKAFNRGKKVIDIYRTRKAAVKAAEALSKEALANLKAVQYIVVKS